MVGGFHTTDGAISGSPAFTAPEVLGGEPPSVASDLYGLGATLFCAATGHAAFERRHGERVVAQFLRIANDPTPSLTGHSIPTLWPRHRTRHGPRPRRPPRQPAEFEAKLRAAQAGSGVAVHQVLRPAAPPESVGSTATHPADAPPTSPHPPRNRFRPPLPPSGRREPG